MIILGAGLNGCIAAFRFPQARILEYLLGPSIHKAVLRFRSDRVSDITGIPFKKVEVTKGIIMADSFVQPNLKLNNLYSRKVTGCANNRSIDNLEKSTRWIAPDDFHYQMLSKLHNRIELGVDYVPTKLDEPIISTIPLPILCDKIGVECPIETAQQAKPIHVRTIELEDVELYQTIYYPDPRFSIYRASITGSKLIIESIDKITTRELIRVIEHFGLTGMVYRNDKEFVQQFGKFIPLEEVKRKKLMYELTHLYGVYSLGRHATWRKILLDDSVHDMDVIERMIQLDEYDLRVGR